MYSMYYMVSSVCIELYCIVYTYILRYVLCTWYVLYGIVLHVCIDLIICIVCMVHIV